MAPVSFWVWEGAFKHQRATHGFLWVRSKAGMFERACRTAVSRIPVTPEVAGSSPVAPATRFPVPIRDKSRRAPKKMAARQGFGAFPGWRLDV